MNTTEFMADLKTAAAIDPGTASVSPAVDPDADTSIWLPAGPCHAGPVTLLDSHIPALIEMILKDRPTMHRLLRARLLHSALVPRFLAIALTGFVLFGLAMSLVLTVSGHWPAMYAIHTWLNTPNIPLLSFVPMSESGGPLAAWTNGNALKLVVAYAFGLVAASGLCLPSLYFYCLLAGIPMTMVEVVLHTLKAKAVSAVALVGILPIYMALAMGVVIFKIPHEYLTVTLALGLLLPFIAGVWGVSSLYEGFSRFADTMPARYSESRKCFLRRLVVAWSICYTAVSPVMIYSVWEVLSR